MSFTKIWIILNAILYLIIGLIGLVRPNYVAEVVGFDLTRPGAFAEVRACYGGLMVAIGCYMLYHLFNHNIIQALLFIFIIYLGFGSGRLVGIIANQAFDKTTLMYVSIEISSALISAILFARLYKV